MSSSSVGHRDPILLADGFEDCIIGLGWQFNKPFVVYSKNKIIAKLAAEFEGSKDESFPFDGEERDFFLEAEEYFSFNIQGGWLGEGTPIFVDEEVNTFELINEVVGDYNV
jgi:hypothetical protein